MIKENKNVDLKILVPLKFFKVLVGLRSQFKYSTSDFTVITKPSYIKKARLFKKHSDFEIQIKSSVSYLNQARSYWGEASGGDSPPPRKKFFSRAQERFGKLIDVNLLQQHDQNYDI